MIPGEGGPGLPPGEVGLPLSSAAEALRVGTLAAPSAGVVLGASTGAANTSFQTPLATLHKFNGTADKFLVTPANGLRDLYATVGHKFGGTAIPGLNAGVTYHRFRSDRADIAYGDEWDAQVAFKIRKVAALVKYASYSANRYATDTKKLWLELDFGL